MASSGNRKQAPRRRRKPATATRQGGVWPWVAALVVVGGGIAAYDNRAQWPAAAALFGPSKPAAVARAAPPRPIFRAPSAAMPARDGVSPITVGAIRPPVAIPVPGPGGKPPAAVPDAKLQATESVVGKGFGATFYYCGTSGLNNCVVDGNTFWYNRTKITLADIEAPATETAKCQNERDRGFAAKVRLRELLNAGKFDLAAWKNGASGQGGKAVLVVTRNGQSLGAMLVTQGLARPKEGRPVPWC